PHTPPSQNSTPSPLYPAPIPHLLCITAMPKATKAAKAKPVAKATKPDPASPPPPPPQWPSFSLPPTHPYTLSPQILLPSQLILIPSLFPPSLCKSYINFLSQLPLITTPSIPQRGMAARINDRFE